MKEAVDAAGVLGRHRLKRTAEYDDTYLRSLRLCDDATNQKTDHTDPQSRLREYGFPPNARTTKHHSTRPHVAWLPRSRQRVWNRFPCHHLRSGSVIGKNPKAVKVINHPDTEKKAQGDQHQRGPLVRSNDKSTQERGVVLLLCGLTKERRKPAQSIQISRLESAQESLVRGRRWHLLQRLRQG